MEILRVKFFIVFLVICLVGGVLASSFGDEWDSYDDEEVSDSEQNIVDDSENVSADLEEGWIEEEVFEEKVAISTGKDYTEDFYLALGVGGVGLLILLFLLFSIFKKPRNKWR
jgi:hypothetical protein